MHRIKDLLEVYLHNASRRNALSVVFMEELLRHVNVV